MKKLWTILLAGALVFMLVACDTVETGSSEKESSPTSESSIEVEATPTAEPTPEPTAEPTSYFTDGVLQTEKFRIEITEYKVIPAGEEGNEYGDAPVLAFWYNTTNLTDDDLNAMTAWLMSFTAVQDNDPNVVNELSVAALPDDRFLQSQMQTIKKDGTVENAMAYELSDTTTPVVLTAQENLLGDVLGEQTFNLE